MLKNVFFQIDRPHPETDRQNKCISPQSSPILPTRDTDVKIVSQSSAESYGFSPLNLHVHRSGLGLSKNTLIARKSLSSRL